MFYCLTPEVMALENCPPSPDTLIAGYVTGAELPQVAAQLGFHQSVVAECLNDMGKHRNILDVYEEYSFGIVDIVEAEDIHMASDRAAFFFKKNLFLLVSLRDEDGSTKKAFEQALRRFKPENITLEKVVYAMLEGAISGDGAALAKFEFDISAMEEELVRGKPNKTFNARIYGWKKRLLLFQNYYEQLIDMGEGLQENENEIFEEETLHYFTLFTAKAERLSSTVNRLCAALNELRAAYQAAMDYNLNSVMKLFSVITTTFLPLTLLVGWYGMNFAHMPELEWEFGYGFVILLSIAIVVANLIFFKKKNLL